MSENWAVTRPTLRELVVDHLAWREALDQVRVALSRPSAIVALLGPAGTGKTLLLRTLLNELRDGGRNAVLLERGDAENRPAARPGIVLVDEADRIGSETLEALAQSETMAEFRRGRYRPSGTTQLRGADRVHARRHGRAASPTRD